MSKLIDFGLAVLKCAPGEIFKHGGGTTDYMAPEVLDLLDIFLKVALETLLEL